LKINLAQGLNVNLNSSWIWD
jgi:hypothetical protein